MPAFSISSDKLITCRTDNLKDALPVDVRDFEQRLMADMGLYDVIISNSTPATNNRTKLWYHKDIRQFKRYDPIAAAWSALAPSQLALHMLHRAVLGAQVDTVLETGDRFLFWDASLQETKAISRENLRSDIGADEASDAEIRTGSVSKYVSARRIYTANAPVTLTDGATITPNFNNGINFVVSLGGDRTLANPTGAKPGQAGMIIVKHSNRQLSYGNAWKFAGGPPSLSSGSNMVDVISYYAETTSILYCTMSKGHE